LLTKVPYPGQNAGSCTEIAECPKKLRKSEFFGFPVGKP
jgi:hypothetical protein